MLQAPADFSDGCTSRECIAGWGCLNDGARDGRRSSRLLEWAEQQRAFTGSVLVVWAREDKLMPPEHAERLAAHFENADHPTPRSSVWVWTSTRSGSPPRTMATRSERQLLAS